MNQSKRCGRCKEVLPAERFYKEKRSKDGLSGYCKECSSANHKVWREENRKHLQDYAREKRYGLDKINYDLLYGIQSGKCAICSSKLTDSGHVDHNHETGEVRGILCSPCNMAIGLLKDDPAILLSAAEYLQDRGHYGKQGRQGISCQEALA